MLICKDDMIQADQMTKLAKDRSALRSLVAPRQKKKKKKKKKKGGTGQNAMVTKHAKTLMGVIFL